MKAFTLMAAVSTAGMVTSGAMAQQPLGIGTNPQGTLNADLPDDLVCDLTRILAEKSDDMAASLPLFRLLDPAEMRKDFGVAFHPGAIRYYAERGIDETKLRS